MIKSPSKYESTLNNEEQHTPSNSNTSVN